MPERGRENKDRTLSVSVKDSYIILKVKNKTIKTLTSPVLTRYVKVKSFNKTDGVLSLIGQMQLTDGTTVNEEDWIDLNETIGFAFGDPAKIIRDIDYIQLM